MTDQNTAALRKMPEVTMLFWIIKIAGTTLGETAGDALSMSLDLGYLASTAILSVVFAVAVAVQLRSKSFHPALYWATIVATTTVGTTMADFADRSLGVGYAGGSALLLTLLILSFLIWKKVMGSVALQGIQSVQGEGFYWLTIMFSQTLGTALGDWTADSEAVGYGGATLIFGGALLLLVAVYFTTKLSRTMLFWLAFVLTRPLGAVVGDFLDKPLEEGGLALDRFTASGALLAVMLLGLAVPVLWSRLSTRRRSP